MRIIKAKDYNEMSRKAANIFFSQINLNNKSVLGLATGSTVLGLYSQLINYYKQGDLDFSQVHSVNLDEYIGLSSDHPQSYRYYMDQNLFNHINIPADQAHLPGGNTDDIEAECAGYDQLIKKLGGIDLQLLGLGLNGHIGFNEPDNAFPKGTHCVSLSDSTIKANSRFFENEEDVPRQAITMGIKTIIQSKHILLCVNGKEKASILKEVLYGPVTPMVPGSILQLHPHFTLVADEDALSLL